MLVENQRDIVLCGIRPSDLFRRTDSELYELCHWKNSDSHIRKKNLKEFLQYSMDTCFGERI